MTSTALDSENVTILLFWWQADLKVIISWYMGDKTEVWTKYYRSTRWKPSIVIRDKEPGDEVPDEEYKPGTDNKGQVNSATMSYTSITFYISQSDFI